MTALEDQVRASLRAAAHRTAVPPPPPARVRASGRHKRRLRLAALLGIVIPSTAVVAAAGGYLPGSLEDAFSFTDVEGVGASTLQRVGAAPGPPGERFELWTRTADTGETCFLSALVPDEQPARTPSTAVLTSSGFCLPPNQPQVRFGGFGGGSDRTFTYAAGVAVRAEVLLGDGTRLATVTAGGQVAGWLPPDRRDDAIVVGYDAAGTTIGSIDLTPWTPPPPPVPGGQGR